MQQQTPHNPSKASADEWQELDPEAQDLYLHPQEHQKAKFFQKDLRLKARIVKTLKLSNLELTKLIFLKDGPSLKNL